jgi:phosphoglucosamine mutase
VEKTETRAPKLFGTDGVRGRAGDPPLDPETVRRLGAALVRALPANARGVRLLVGRDTRESGVWIEEALARGANGEGAAVTSLGVVPTPAVAYLTRSSGYDAGIVISASHNPFEDNGVKVFSAAGEKLPEAVERQIEAMIADAGWHLADAPATENTRADLVGAYLDHLRPVLAGAAFPFTLVVDCANGATTTVAPLLFASLGLSTMVIGDEPDGRNINLQCGSTHPTRLAETVVRTGAGMGVAFDGDGDRAIFVDHTGRVVDGDAVLLMCARQLQREGRLRNDAIVATVMSNIGLEIALRKSGIEIVRCAVGDKYVMEEMAARGLSLGGEQSGHIIFSDYLSTGDGLCTALNVLRTVAVSGRSLADLAGELVAYPQVLLNLRVREKRDVRTIPAARAAIEAIETRLDGNGRLLVRYSGTEPLLRVMIEGQDQQQIHAWAEEIIAAVRQEIG